MRYILITLISVCLTTTTKAQTSKLLTEVLDKRNKALLKYPDSIRISKYKLYTLYYEEVFANVTFAVDNELGVFYCISNADTVNNFKVIHDLYMTEFAKKNKPEIGIYELKDVRFYFREYKRNESFNE